MDRINAVWPRSNSQPSTAPTRTRTTTPSDDHRISRAIRVARANSIEAARSARSTARSITDIRSGSRRWW